MIKFILKNIYYRFKIRSFSQLGEDLIIENQFGRLKDHFKNLYIDIGGYAPYALSNTYKFYNKSWRGYIYEPNKYKCFLFKILRPKDKIFNMAVTSNKNLNERILFVAKSFYDENQKSLTEYTIESKKDFKKRFFVETLNINILLEKVFKKEKIKVLKYLKIDCEGMDDEIINSINFNKFTFALIACEDFLSKYNNKGDVFNYQKSNIYKVLSKKGYLLSSIAGPTCIYINKKFLKD